MKKVIRLTERDLTRLVKRVINEQQFEEMREEESIMVSNKSEDEVREILESLPESIKFILIKNSEYADFSNIDVCSLPNLLFINLQNTENNLEDNANCKYDVFQSMFIFNAGREQ